MLKEYLVITTKEVPYTGETYYWWTVSLLDQEINEISIWQIPFAFYPGDVVIWNDETEEWYKKPMLTEARDLF